MIRHSRWLGAVLLLLAIAWEASVALFVRPFRWGVPGGSYALASIASVLLVWPLHADRKSALRLVASYTLALAITGISGLAGWHAFELGAVVLRVITYLLLPWLWLTAQLKP